MGLFGRRRAAANVSGAVMGRPRRSLLGRLFLGLTSSLFLGLLIGAGLFAYGHHLYGAPGPLARTKLVEVERGSGIRAIAENLEREGVIRDAHLFMAAVFLTNNAAKLKAGDYRFPARVSMREVLDDLVTGKALVYKLTVPEGWTSQQVVERVKAHEALAGEITAVPAEGSLLPETYVFERGFGRQALLDQMADAQKRLLDELWPQRAPNLPIKTREEAVILASIVEKETGVPAERPQVAAVFANRLLKGMRLQSDPTIIYGLVGGAGSLGRPLTRKDIESKTPYNTYVIKGLPPTPIANPGRASIAAVLNPIESSDLYFVADGTGGHAFAPNLKMHQQNVRKWRQIQRQRRAQAAAQQQAGDAQDEGAMAPDEAGVDDLTEADAAGEAATQPAGQQDAAAQGAADQPARSPAAAAAATAAAAAAAAATAGADEP
ncbi:endolytic transglycosylase MltG, partial [Rhodoligotrophos defluvii]|uniref:endolytic transglycosylase MltG n=1 Tax=Rhodoligotrophos defluvii TaxID=2561934 RepID=UPI001962138D